MDQVNNSFKGWIARLNQEDMPIFGRTVQAIVSIAEDSESSISELANVILQDSSMTSKVLRLANTAFYNPSNRSVSTVSRAVMLVGFDTIRAISLTLALVESIVRSGNRDHLMAELARSLHAATQARSLARTMGDSAAEEIFVATLLYNVGELAFWCFAKEEGEALISARARGLSKEEAEQAVLGFSFSRLTRQLVKDWQLVPLLADALDPSKKNDIHTQIISISHELSAAAEKGWESKQVHDVTHKIAKLAKLPEDEIAASLHRNAREAASVSRSYGIGKVASIIPTPHTGKGKSAASTEDVWDMGEHWDGQNDELTGYNPSLQPSILRDMTTLLMEKPDFNLLLEMALEGIYRGVGMDRALFALITVDRQHIKARFALGLEREILRNRFRFSMAPGRPSPFKMILDSHQPAWVGHPQSPLNEFISDGIIDILGGASFFAAPIVVDGKGIGIIYADRLPSGRDLDQPSFDNFNFFAQQAGMGLNHIAKMRRG